jgi:hypothetical protein
MKTIQVILTINVTVRQANGRQGRQAPDYRLWGATPEERNVKFIRQNYLKQSFQKLQF